jgi:hypothetical protein
LGLVKAVAPLLAVLLFQLPLTAHAAAAATDGVSLIRLDDRVRVEIGGQLFTEYLFRGAMRPYLYPVLAADGTSLTRDFPMKEVPGEDTDHPHHRSLWFAHSNVNGIDFWNEGANVGTRFPKGSIVHDGLVEVSSGTVGVIRARNRWVAPDGVLICTDETTIRIRELSGGGRFLDYEVTVFAQPSTPLLMGDNKDGTMAIRVPQWMNLAEQVTRHTPGVGNIVLGTGLRDADAWGKRAPWCDYFAVHNGRTYGIAIFDHPSNPRHPTWWMTRDYGLFAANPFGQNDFEALGRPGAGDLTIPAGGSLTLRYRFYFHYGDAEEAGVAGRYAEYAASRQAGAP